MRVIASADSARIVLSRSNLRRGFPPAQLESELLGHEKGAFAGAAARLLQPN
jgi:hypothetical protein